VGATADALAALSKGLVQFVILVEPFVREAEKLGCKSPVDVSLAEHSVSLERRAYAGSNCSIQGAVDRQVRPRPRRSHPCLQTDKESTLKIISKFTRITNADSLVRTHQAFAKILPENPSPSQEGVKTYLDYLAATRPEAAKANPKEFVDLSFSQELKASGYSK
jgi:hypothetical protein